MKYAIWALQVILALLFLLAGLTKIFTPITNLADMMAWTTSVPAALVRFSGVAEALGGLGLLLPWLTGIQPQLVRAAAAGLVLTMAGAVITHVAIGDPFTQAIPPLVLGLLAAALTYARTRVLPLPAPG